MKIPILIGLSMLSLSAAATLTSYDQRQEGELNVKVDLDNFVIVVARPSPSFDFFGSMASLLGDAKRNSVAIDDETELDSKPLEDNDDEKAKRLDNVSLDKEPPEAMKSNEEAVIVLVETDAEATSAENKTIVSTSLGKATRTLRNLKIKEASQAGDKTKSLLSSKYKFVDSVDEPKTLKLIGDAIEACGPGRSRDRFGICKQERNV